MGTTPRRTAYACLWDGHDLPAYSAHRYGRRDVEALLRGLERHAPGVELSLFVDAACTPAVQDLGIPLLPFAHQHRGGWSQRLEAVAPPHWPAPGERRVLFDLDQILVGECSWLWEWDEAPVGCPPDPYFMAEVCSTVVTWDLAGAKAIWGLYQDGELHELTYARGRFSEMALLRAMHKRGGVGLLDPERKKLLSYKVDIAAEKPWHEASVVYFHGNPKPWRLPASHALRKEWDRAAI